MAESVEMGEINDVASNDGEVLTNGEVTKDVEMKDLTTETNKGNIDKSIRDVDMETGEKDSSNGSVMDDEDIPPSPSSGSSENSQDLDNKRPEGLDELDGDTNTNSSVLQEEESTEHSNLSSSQKQDEDDNTNSSSSSSSSSRSRSSVAETTDSKTQELLYNDNSIDNSNDKKAKSESELIQDDSESKTESAKNDHSENSSDQQTSIDENCLLQDDEVRQVDDDDDVDDISDDDDEIDDFHDDDDVGEKRKESKPPETIELNSEDDGDVMIVDGPKTNGKSPRHDDDVINLIESPDKKESAQRLIETATPRRSTRNINKNKSYVECDKEDSPPRHTAISRPSANNPSRNNHDSDGSDIEEILPEDPLAGTDQVTVERIRNNKKHTIETSSSTIVVKDTKKLVEIASKTNHSSSSASGGKKEPTLVIIDTNSILSGRGAIPMNKSSTSSNSNSMNSSQMTPVLPMAVPAQGMYPPNMRATITPIPVNTQHHVTQKNSTALVPSSSNNAPTPLLPTLTDDMFVVEAPSFIVPYVYEKPPVKLLKDLVSDLKKSDTKKEKKEKKEETTSDVMKVAKKPKEDDDESDGTFSDDSDDEENKLHSDTKPYSYFHSALGNFFIQIGSSIVQEHVQNDLLKQQKRKRDREQGSNPETNKTIASLMKNIEMTKENNEPFKLEIKKCEFCNFKTESTLAMAYHLETPHMRNFVYKCNFCTYEVRSPHDILFHMEAEHAIRGHLERAPAFHQCPSCPFEDNQKGKLSRHLVVCARKFKADRNLEPPLDWEPPAKIPRLPKMRASGLNATVAAYQTLANKNAQQYQFLSKMQLQANANAALNRGRGRPTLTAGNLKPQSSVIRPQGMVFKPQSGNPLLLPSNYHLSGGNSFYQVMGGAEFSGRLGPVPGMAYIPSSAQAPGPLQSNSSSSQSNKKSSNTPSISITPLPRGTTSGISMKPGDMNSKSAYVICEICDGYIRDLEQLRNHMQWIHKIKIHPKMIHNRPPLNCQKCQFRFFTDQGLERHLLGSHGLVTSSMQDAANKSKDSGRCPLCGKVYQWKLLNHVARDHGLTLKPAHLSYKCTVCTATFGMYKQFENHVYSAHSVVAKRVMDKKSTSSGLASSSKMHRASASPCADAHAAEIQGQCTKFKTTDMKPLKINDEITIIPQPAKSTTNGSNREGSPAMKSSASTSKNR